MNAHIHTKATNIQWDTDGDAKALSKLPGEIDIPDGMTDEDEISDYISNVTGFCHFGFDLSYEPKKTNKKTLPL